MRVSESFVRQLFTSASRVAMVKLLRDMWFAASKPKVSVGFYRIDEKCHSLTAVIFDLKMNFKIYNQG